MNPSIPSTASDQPFKSISQRDTRHRSYSAITKFTANRQEHQEHHQTTTNSKHTRFPTSAPFRHTSGLSMTKDSYLNCILPKCIIPTQFQRRLFAKPGRTISCLYHILLAVILLMTVFIINDERGMVDGKLYLVRARMSRPKKCKVHVNLPLYVVMDRVCVLCHEMFSHERPNMRAECSRNCYRSEQFRRCLDVFAPPKEFNSLEEILETAALKDTDDIKR